MKILLMITMALAVNIAGAQYKPVDGGSSLQFTIKNLGFDVNGTFKGFEGAINFDPANIASASFDVSIDAGTINTDNSLRDNHLRGESYFDTGHYPTIHFVSTRVTEQSGSYKITGKLTIKKTTQTISFPFTAVSSGDGYVFKGKFSIKRRDFDVGGFSTISDDLVVVLNVVARKN